MANKRRGQKRERSKARFLVIQARIIVLAHAQSSALLQDGDDDIKVRGFQIIEKEKGMKKG